MKNSRNLMCVCFCAGLLGAVISHWVAWAINKTGLAYYCGVVPPAAGPGPWLYPGLIAGGLWGLVYFLTVSSPRSRNQWVRKGLWSGLAPAALLLFYTFPNRTPFGLLGLEIGTLTPLFVLFYQLTWGAATGIWARALWGRNR